MDAWIQGGGGGVTSLPYKVYPILFLRQDIEDQVV